MANIKFYKKSTRPTNITDGSLWFDSSKNRIILTGASSSADIMFGSYLNNCSVANGTLTITKIDGTSVSLSNTDTKVTSVGNHYTPVEDSAQQLNAIPNGGNTIAWGAEIVTGASIKRDAKGHVTGISVNSGLLPVNPNTDTKVTSVENHYIPSNGNAKSATNGVLSSVAVDAAGHVTAVGSSTGFNASLITAGTIDIARLPQGALERLVIVENDTKRFALTQSDVQDGDTVKVTATGKMYFVKDSTKLSSESGYEVYAAGTAASVPWSGVTGKPDSYTPSSHTHTKSQITDFPTRLSQFTNDLTLDFTKDEALTTSEIDAAINKAG